MRVSTSSFAWDVRSSVSFNECMFLAELARGRNVLEIGSWLGRSTIALASTAVSVVAVDWHQGDQFSGTDVQTEPQMRSNLERYGARNVRMVVQKIEDAVLDLPPIFEGVFIDADHAAEDVRRHYEIAYRLCLPGGWIAFHDYGVTMEGFGVTEIVDSVGLIISSCETIAVIRREE